MNALTLLALFVGIAIGFCAAFFLVLLAYRMAEMNLKEAKLEKARLEFAQLSESLSEEKK